jgi:hypothetical protein
MKHSRRARAALLRLAEDDPALGALALWCVHLDGEGRDLPAWSDGRGVTYGPAFERLAPHEQSGLAAHHVLHVALRHAARAGAMRMRLGDRFDAALFALACDAILNDTLAAAGHALPRPAVGLAGLLAAALPGEAAVAAWDAERLYLRLAEAAGGDGGSAAGGAAAWAAGHARENRFVPDFDAAETGGGGPAAEAAEAAAWAERLARALAAGRAAGRGIGAPGSPPLDLPRATVPWERVLRRLVTRAVTAAPAPDWRRPSRRWLARDSDARAAGLAAPAFEPARGAERPRPRIAACIDTSTSIDAACLARFAAELAAIARRTGAEVHAIAFDTGVAFCRRLPPGAWEATVARLPFRRGGGTDFAPALAAAAATDPSVVVVLTDLDGPSGPAPPRRLPVIWAVPDDPAPAAPFGRVVSLAR